MPYLYTVRMAPTAVTVAKTLIQIKPVTAPIFIVRAKVFQVTKISASELLEIQQIKYAGGFTAATVTSATALLKGSSRDPASLAVGSTSATGVNATVEPSGGTANILDDDDWNTLNASWTDLPIPEDRIGPVITGELYGLKLNTAPGASMTIGALVDYIEFS